MCDRVDGGIESKRGETKIKEFIITIIVLCTFHEALVYSVYVSLKNY